MPPVAAALAAAATAAGYASVSSFIIGSLVSTVISFGLQAVAGAIAGKPKQPNQNFGNLSQALQQTIRQPITERRIVYGQARAGGAMACIATHDDNKYLHIATLLATHEVEGIETVYLNDDPIYPDMIDGSGLVTVGKYANRVRIKKHLGTDGQAADSDMVAEIPGWTSNHKLSGIAYVYVRFKYEAEVFATGIPNVSAIVRGKKLYDPRDGVTRYSNNPSLVLRDYLTNTRYGRSRPTNEMDDTYFSSAANTCDEMVDTLAVTDTVTSVSITGDYLEFTGELSKFITGDRVQVAATTTMPGGITAATNYFAIVTRERAFSDDDATTGRTRIQLATTYKNAMAHTFIDITSIGAGTITVSKNAEPRYCCDGVIPLDQNPAEILNNIGASMGGTMLYSSGVWRPLVGAYPGVTYNFTDDDIVAAMDIQTRRSRSERFNCIIGQYSSPQTYNQATDYPGIKIATYISQDNGEEIWGSLDLPLTVRGAMAQRIARIALEKIRREITLDIETNLKGMIAAPGDVITINVDEYGWTTKAFEVINWKLGLSAQDSDDDAPAMVCRMELRELDANVFAFNYATDETGINPAPRSTLPNPLSVAPPTGLTIDSGDAYLYTRADGTVFSRIFVTFTPSATPTKYYEMQYKESLAVSWSRPIFIPNDQTEVYILEAQEGVNYDVRIRAMSSIGVPSAYVSGSHLVVGKTTPPDDVTYFSANSNGNVVLFQWLQVADTDIAGYEIRYDVFGGTDWNNAVTVKIAERGDELTTAAIPPGSWTCFIKAINTSGIYSDNALTADVVVTNANTIVAEATQNPDWPGTRTNMLQHWSTGSLVPDDQEMASNNSIDIFGEFLINPYATYQYEPPEIDLGNDAQSALRVWLQVQGGISPSETGFFDYTAEIDYKTTAGSYDGFEPWDIGDLTNFRYLKTRFTLDISDGQGYFESASPIVDGKLRSETGSQIVDGTGTYAVTFAVPFLNVPVVTTGNMENNNKIVSATNITRTGFDLNIKDSSNAASAGIGSYNATGV